MPTGYTHPIIEKEGYTFQQFAMACARAFGACVEMRDDPADAPIPEKFEPSDYSVKRLAEAEAELKTLRAMDESERREYGLVQKVKRIKDAHASLEKRREEAAKYQAMLEQVNDWVPPSGDHENFKEFMAEQIRISIDDPKYAEERLAEANAADPFEIWREAVEVAVSSIARHKKGIIEDRERAESRTRWIQQLRDSLNSEELVKTA